MQRVLTLLFAVALVAAACGDDGGGAEGVSPADSSAPPTTDTSEPAAAATTTPDGDDETGFTGTLDLDLAGQEHCEVIGEECLLPFPSDALTVADPTTPTGRRVALAADSLPANADGVHIDPSRQNRNDGFSPGSAALVLVPGVDPETSGLPPITDLARSLDGASASVIIDATTGERWPHWAELDANAADPARRGLFLRPAVNYPEGHRIVVGLRHLVGDDGAPIEPTEAFRALRDRLSTDEPLVEDRRAAMEEVFAVLADAGVARDDLVLAWDFTVISTESLTGPLLHMRDDAFARLGDDAPEFTVETVERSGDDTYTIIEGTYDVPLYLTGDGSSGNGLNVTDDPDLPAANGTWSSVYRCMIHDNTTAEAPGAGVLYGHGLLGTKSQVTSAGPRLLAEHHNYVVCGTDLIGMAEEDLLNAAAILTDLSTFPTLADRLLQGHLDTLFLGRLMKHPDGFAADPAFRDPQGRPLLSTEDFVGYYGISQGGIMGPVSTAVATDWDRGVFGVPAVNYSTLLNRSVDFDRFQLLLDPSYPDKLDQALALLIVQMLWDRGEGNGYVNHYTEPLPGSGEKRALLHGALGDHQVANVAMEVMARSIGASVVWPAVAEGRSTDVEPFWGIPHIERYPHAGSAVVMWDSGAPLPPITNTPPREGTDPHEDPRRHLAAVDQIDAFLRTGEVIDVCGGAPCISPPRG